MVTSSNPAVLDAEGLDEAPDVSRNVLVALDPAVDEQGWGQENPQRVRIEKSRGLHGGLQNCPHTTPFFLPSKDP